MGILNYIKNTLSLSGDNSMRLDVFESGIEGNTYYKTLAIEAGIRLISKTLARADFQTFNEGEEVKKINHYMLNVEANKNTSANLFWIEAVEKLLIEGEVLILIQDEQLFLADSFTRQEFAFKENIYSEIVIKNHELKENKPEGQVIYLKDSNTKIKSAINGIYKDYSDLIQSSKKGYSNSKSRKGTLEIPMNYAKTFDQDGALQKHISGLMKDFMDPTKDAVFPETNGLKYTEVSEAKGSKSNDSGRETDNFIKDLFDFTAIALGIPPSLLKGDTVDMKDAVNNFLAFCINPLANLIEGEINRKLYGRDLFLENTYTKLDTSNIKSVDLRDIANSLELLTRTGSNTIDDNLRALGREPVRGEIGKMRFITKNLGSVESILKEEKGGD